MVNYQCMVTNIQGLNGGVGARRKSRKGEGF